MPSQNSSPSLWLMRYWTPRYLEHWSWGCQPTDWAARSFSFRNTKSISIPSIYSRIPRLAPESSCKLQRSKVGWYRQHPFGQAIRQVSLSRTRLIILAGIRSRNYWFWCSWQIHIVIVCWRLFALCPWVLQGFLACKTYRCTRCPRFGPYCTGSWCTWWTLTISSCTSWRSRLLKGLWRAHPEVQSALTIRHLLLLLPWMYWIMCPCFLWD